jgi:hypothetical protein
MKLIIMMMCLLAIVIFAQTYEDIKDSEASEDYQTKFEQDVIGQRTSVHRISEWNYLVIGSLKSRTFIAIQSDNGQPEQSVINQKNISIAHLERMRYIAFIKNPNDIDKLMKGETINVIRCGGSGWGNRTEYNEKLVFRTINGVKCFHPLNDWEEFYYVTKALKGFN